MLSGTMTHLSFGYALKYLPLTIANMILCFLPFINALGAFFILHEKITQSTFIAMVISFSAILILAFADPGEGVQKSSDEAVSQMPP